MIAVGLYDGQPDPYWIGLLKLFDGRIE